MLKQTTGNRDAGFIDQGEELKVKSDIQCVFVALMLGKAFAPRPARLFCFSALLLPPPSRTYLGVRAKWHWLLQQIHRSLKRLLSPFFPFAGPSESASFYPLSHTHILSLPVNTRTHTNARSPYICLSHIHTYSSA